MDETTALNHQRAITHVTVEQKLEGATLVSCKLETGRQHQIRIHLSEAGNPLVGERVYVRNYKGSIIPAPRLMLHAANANLGPVTLSVNGSAAYPVLVNGDQPLLPGDVGTGSTVSVVFDGTAFQLISARRLERKPCPPGTTQVNELYCIEDVQHDTLDFPHAANVCGSLGLKLCSWAQFYNACYHASELGLTDMVGDWEWTDDAANSDNSVRVTGQTSCTQISVTVGYGVIARNFHCCFRR